LYVLTITRQVIVALPVYAGQRDNRCDIEVV